VRRPRLEVADVFHRHGTAWRKANAGHVSLDQLKVMSAIESCRSAALGGHLERCEECGHSRIADNSCRNRHCPKCQGAAAKDWLAARQADLPPVGYFHLVFTLPAQIAAIADQNKLVVYDLLFRTASETLLTIAADPKHLGARIGATAVLHSWGSAMTHHPHLHMIVPGGGISLDGTHWVHCRPGFLLPVRVLSRLFRRLFLTRLADAHAAGRLAFFGKIQDLHHREAFAAHLAPLRRKKWFVYGKPPFAAPEACSPISRATPTASPSRTADWSASMTVASPSASRTTAATAGAVSHDDAGARRVHQALHAPRSAEGLPSHPPLRIARQRHLQSQHSARQRTDRRVSGSDRSAGSTMTPTWTSAPHQTIARYAPVAAAA